MTNGYAETLTGYEQETDIKSPAQFEVTYRSYLDMTVLSRRTAYTTTTRSFFTSMTSMILSDSVSMRNIMIWQICFLITNLRSGEPAIGLLYPSRHWHNVEITSFSFSSLGRQCLDHSSAMLVCLYVDLFSLRTLWNYRIHTSLKF